MLQLLVVLSPSYPRCPPPLLAGALSLVRWRFLPTALPAPGVAFGLDYRLATLTRWAVHAVFLRSLRRRISAATTRPTQRNSSFVRCVMERSVRRRSLRRARGRSGC